ncbi:MAG: hypothetical protein HYV25_02160, partial [Candidatus Harrisonbacteria bacterium]|nr:hypothetical protein [Candidatus Harrisonbacteria bacterium]
NDALLLSNDLAAAEKNFFAALDDDFNTPEALAALFSLIGRYEKEIWTLSNADAKTLAGMLKKLFGMLGMEFQTEKIPAKITTLVKKRGTLRVKKDFAGADALRKIIEGLGYKVEDTPLGPLVLRDD